MKPYRSIAVTNRTTLERAVALAIYFVCTRNVRSQAVTVLVAQVMVLWVRS